MLVRDDNASTGWRTWCGYGLAREDGPKPYLGVTNSRLCSKCKRLAADAIADETMVESEAEPFAYAPETAATENIDDAGDSFPDDALPVHHLDDDNSGLQRGQCPHSGGARTRNGGCPRGCDAARYHYANDGHRACAERTPA